VPVVIPVAGMPPASVWWDHAYGTFIYPLSQYR